jgi:Family of unknown function (DUF6334)
VSDLATESGPLLRVMGIAAAAGRYRSLEFEFALGVLSLHCDDVTDEIIVKVGRDDAAALPVADSWANDVLGKCIEYAWELRNHRGYNDGFQLRLMDDEREEESRQFEVAGSVLEVRLVSSGNAAA